MLAHMWVQPGYVDIRLYSSHSLFLLGGLRANERMDEPVVRVEARLDDCGCLGKQGEGRGGLKEVVL